MTTTFKNTNESRPVHANEQLWANSIGFHNSYVIHKDEGIDAAIANSENNELPQIAVAANEGKFLKLAAQTIGAKRVLEVGTLGGVSTIWMARGIPKDGRIVTLEVKQKHADVAKQNWELAGVASQIEVIVGDGVETIKSLRPSEPFDLVFIDADKKSNPTYYAEAKRMLRSGGVIIVDNVVRDGRVADLSNDDPTNVGIRQMVALIKEDKEVDATVIQTVGDKGFDGFLYARKL
ncbi:O-methyltransferase family 3 protein [Coniophora puteana RWD-64-598 SS2]|uniref:O-methyltransferase family 3 protein n=1 Tax=Coniophora puteana (strain RWD-64-598) TaxID=741705 RepID=A0A5M3N2P9_CONPW|nr:O-methyltransferase family 3 protein [Coniophora puteana RWD-64-598 SS2]EIW85648.1 O-methyltransferase family 3 protein [Coniophora puteana RWD-64-598 SS2]